MSIQRWWHSNPGSIPNWEGPLISRAGLLMAVMLDTETANGAKPGASIAMVYFDLDNRKGMWDGDPDRLLRKIEQVHPCFWDDYPGKAETDIQRKAILSRQAATWKDAGAARHQKPNLRKDATQ